MLKNHERASSAEARTQVRQARITQSQLAKAIGVSQSQVSRILSGQTRRQSRLLDDICIYVRTVRQGVSPDTVRANDELINALAETWNGSPEHAHALAAVIRSLAMLTDAPPPRRQEGGEGANPR